MRYLWGLGLCLAICPCLATEPEEQTLSTADQKCAIHYLTFKPKKLWHIEVDPSYCTTGWVQGFTTVQLKDALNRPAKTMSGYTMVIKLNSYDKIQVSLDEFNQFSRSYQPVYPQVTDLSLEQIDLITRTLELPDNDPRIHALAEKVKQLLHISTPLERSDDTFLWRIVKDYQYYALEVI